jgi:hypothetical protein
MQDFQKIGSWQKSHALTLKIYEATNLFPQTEIYGLISQMRRSSALVPTNIAEGCGRDGVAELKRFMTIALDSDLDTNQFQELERDIIEVKRMIAGYIRSLKPDN